MLNGNRKVWYYKKKENIYGGLISKDWHIVKVCPSTWHFSVITNNSWPAAVFLSMIPSAMLIAGGVLLTVFISWLLGIFAFLAAFVTPSLVIVRYIKSYSWRGDEDIRYVQASFDKMSKEKRKEYAKYLEGAYARTVDLDKALKLFMSCAKESGLNKDLDDEIKVQQLVQASMVGALDESS